MDIKTDFLKTVITLFPLNVTEGAKEIAYQLRALAVLSASGLNSQHPYDALQP